LLPVVKSICKRGGPYVFDHQFSTGWFFAKSDRNIADSGGTVGMLVLVWTVIGMMACFILRGVGPPRRANGLKVQ
jgi:hypothetical protein